MDKGSAISLLRSFTSFEDIPSRPQLLLGFNSFIIILILRLSVGCKNTDLGQLPIKYSLNCFDDGPIEAAHCLPISVKSEQNALPILRFVFSFDIIHVKKFDLLRFFPKSLFRIFHVFDILPLCCSICSL